MVEDVGEGVADVVAAVVVQTGTVIVLSCNVTAPFWASNRPETVAPVSAATDVSARMLPTNVVELPSVAELPTCQNTLQARAPPVSCTTLADEVINVELGALKMKTAAGLLPASSVSVPVRLRAGDPAYTPGPSVRPPRLPASVVTGVRPRASR